MFFGYRLCLIPQMGRHLSGSSTKLIRSLFSSRKENSDGGQHSHLLEEDNLIKFGQKLDNLYEKRCFSALANASLKQTTISKYNKKVKL